MDVMSLNEFPGHDRCRCEVCQDNEASVLMLAHDGEQTAKAHLCLTCFELAEASGFDQIIESTPPERHIAAARSHELVHEW